MRPAARRALAALALAALAALAHGGCFRAADFDPDAAGAGGAGASGGAAASEGGSGGLAAGGAGGGSAGGAGGGPACAAPCGGACCSGGALCVKTLLGPTICSLPCAKSADCPPESPCCALLNNGGGACAASPSKGEYQCTCAASSECPGGACAPRADPSRVPTAPYVCAPQDGARYHGCVGADGACDGKGCCVTDTNGARYCASPCVDDADCGGARCYSFTASSCAAGACAP